MFAATYETGERRIPSTLPRLIGFMGGFGTCRDCCIRFFIWWQKDHFIPQLSERKIRETVHGMYRRYNYKNSCEHESSPFLREATRYAQGTVPPPPQTSPLGSTPSLGHRYFDLLRQSKERAEANGVELGHNGPDVVSLLDISVHLRDSRLFPAHDELISMISMVGGAKEETIDRRIERAKQCCWVRFDNCQDHGDVRKGRQHCCEKYDPWCPSRASLNIANWEVEDLEGEAGYRCLWFAAPFRMYNERGYATTKSLRAWKREWERLVRKVTHRKLHKGKGVARGISFFLSRTEDSVAVREDEAGDADDVIVAAERLGAALHAGKRFQAADELKLQLFAEATSWLPA